MTLDPRMKLSSPGYLFTIVRNQCLWLDERKYFLYYSKSVLPMTEATSYMWLFNNSNQLKVTKIKIQFLSHTTHILSGSLPFLVSGYHIKQQRCREFPLSEKALLDNIVLYYKSLKRLNLLGSSNTLKMWNL